jgi:cardiolipin synthase
MKQLTDKQKKWIERTVANDRSYKVLLYNRFFLVLLFVLAQLVGYGVLLLAFAYNSQVGVFVQLAVFVLELVFILQIISDTQHPSTKLNWIIVILIFPIFGVPMYLFNGGGRPARRMKKKVETSRGELFVEWEQSNIKPDLPTKNTRADGITKYVASYAGYPVYKNGEVKYYKSGEEAFPEMLDELRKAKKYILLEYFIIAHGKMWSEILKILLEKATQGVKVRIIYDDFGCMMNLPPRYDRYLEDLNENIKCLSFNSVVPFFSLRMNNRDHRKIMIIDGKTAFTGGVNLADEYIAEKRRFGYWKDTLVRVKGDAVNSFTAMFLYLWNAFRKDALSADEYFVKPDGERKNGLCIQPYDDSPYDALSIGESVYLDILDRAKDYVWIFTPYLILDDMTRAAICRAAMRGVDVRIVTPAVPDKKIVYRLTRANYDILMKVGVKIYEYTPGFIHAKSMVSDDECAVVGTINLDYRSLYQHFENAVYFSGCDAVQDVKKDCEEVFSVSKLCTEKDLKRTWLGRLVNAVLRVFETLF